MLRRRGKDSFKNHNAVPLTERIGTVHSLNEQAIWRSWSDKKEWCTTCGGEITNTEYFLGRVREPAPQAGSGHASCLPLFSFLLFFFAFPSASYGPAVVLVQAAMVSLRYVLTTKQDPRWWIVHIGRASRRRCLASEREGRK